MTEESGALTTITTTYDEHLRPRTSRNATSEADLFWGDPDDEREFPFFTGVGRETDRAEDTREEGETLVLMARVNGLGRLIPTPALNKIMLHRVVGGLEDPHLNRTLYLYNEPSTVTVSQSHANVEMSPSSRHSGLSEWTNGCCRQIAHSGLGCIV